MVAIKKRIRQHFIWCLVTCFFLTQTLFAGIALGEPANSARLSGSNRYETAVAISQKGWNKSSFAVLARGDNYADALCSGPLAKKYGAPILLTESSQLNTATLDELKRLDVDHVFLIGGTGAISSEVENTLISQGFSTVERIAGATRYETSVKIAEKLGDVSEAILATGSGFADALSISPIAVKRKMPILLTGRDVLPEKVEQFINDKQVDKTYVIGGLGVIGEAILDSLPNPLRLGGEDRYHTNTLIMKNFEEELDFRNIYVAVGNGVTGNEFADALAGAVLAAKKSAPVVLVYKNLPTVTADYIKSKVSIATRGIALGGESVVPSSILDTISSYVNMVEVSETYSQPATYGPDQETKTIDGNVIISARDVVLQNTVIEGDLLLAESIGDGNVTLNNVTVKGITTVRGGGPNSVIMYNFNGETVTVDVPDGANVRVVARGNTSVLVVEMESDGTLEEDGVEGIGFGDIAIPNGAEVTLSGEFNTVDMEASGTNIKLAKDSTINNLNVSEGASNATINMEGNVNVNNFTIDSGSSGTSVNMASGSSVDNFLINQGSANTRLNIDEDARVSNLQSDAPSQITGLGTIDNATINSTGVSIQQQPTNTKISPGLYANVGGSTVIGDTPITQDPGDSDRDPSIKAITGLTKSGRNAFAKLLDVGEDYVLPQIAEVYMSNWTTQNQSITWSPSSVDTTSEGQYTFSGDVENYPYAITLTVTVKQILSNQIDTEFVVN